MEYKSASSGFELGDWLKLYVYTALYDCTHLKTPAARKELGMVFLVARITNNVKKEAKNLGWLIEACEVLGYYRVSGGIYDSWLISIDEVTEAERDEILQVFAHRSTRQRLMLPRHEVLNVLRYYLAKDVQMKREDLPEYEEMIATLMEAAPAHLRLAGLSPKQRLAGLNPEERLAGLNPKQRLAGLNPEERLAGLNPEERGLDLSDEEALFVLSNDMLRLMVLPNIDKLSDETRVKLKKTSEVII